MTTDWNDDARSVTGESHQPNCKICGEEMESEMCGSCGGEGYADEFHDCGEDSCCCLDPEPGMCEDCDGTGVLSFCLNIERHVRDALAARAK